MKKSRTRAVARIIAFAAMVALILTSPQLTERADAQTAGTGAGEEGAPTPEAAPPSTANPTQDLIEIPIRPLGARTLIPLAVPDAYNQGSADPRGFATSIGETMRNCFDLAGYFEVYGPDRYFFDQFSDGFTASTINFPNWYAVGAQALIKSAFRVEGEQVALDFRLYNVDTAQQIDVGWEAKTVALDAMRGELYAFVNAVIEYYTGTAGIFGTRIVYSARQGGAAKQIHMMYADGTGRTVVTDNQSINVLPSWGPGGSVLFTSYIQGNTDLFISRGGSIEALSTRPGLNTGGAYCDGMIAATLSMDGDPDVYLMNMEGEILQQLTDSPSVDTSPTWSPDCSQIAFVSGRSGGPQIYIMGRDGSGQRRITFAGSYNTTPEWSPLGDKIAFTGRDSRNRFDIFVVDVRTSFIERLTQDQGDNEEPTWSPDGRYIAFQSNRGGGDYRLYLMTSDGQYQRPLTPDASGYQTPAWSR